MMTLQKDIIRNTEAFIQEKMREASACHDWYHVDRVRRLANFIQCREGGNSFIIEMAALLHDLEDWKFSGSEDYALTKDWLIQQGVSLENQEAILFIIQNLSFKGAEVNEVILPLEGKIVQDADRLDAIGAIGIARTFAYGGLKKRKLYEPNEQPEMHASCESYRASNGHTINHFHEKLLLLKDRLNTPTAKELAESRHQFMCDFLTQFEAEWNIV